MPRSVQTPASYERDLTEYARQLSAYSAAVQAWESVRQLPTMQAAGGAPTPPTPPAKPSKPDEYSDRLAKYIPSEVVTLYLALLLATAQAKADKASGEWMTGVLGEQWVAVLHWAIFVTGVIATPLTLRFLLQVTRWQHHLICLGSFVVWAVAMPDGAFAGWPLVFRALLLPIYTFAVAFYRPKE